MKFTVCILHRLTIITIGIRKMNNSIGKLNINLISVEGSREQLPFTWFYFTPYFATLICEVIVG